MTKSEKKEKEDLVTENEKQKSELKNKEQSEESLENKLTDIWLERKKYYLDCADHIINTDYLNSDEVVDKIKYILEIECSEKS